MRGMAMYLVLALSLVAPTGCMVFNDPSEPQPAPGDSDSGDVIPDTPKAPRSFAGSPVQHACSDEDFANKEYDLVMVGSYAYVGRLAAEYLAKGHPDSPRWALAGRDSKALETEFFEFQETAASPAAIITLDENDPEALMNMAQKTRTILNFAGPYENNRGISGEDLIRAAMEGCANYVDISAETAWKSFIVNKYGHLASLRGVAIVQGAGFSSLASDYMAMQAAADMASYGHKEPPAEIVVIWNKINGFQTGGQAASTRYSVQRHGLNNDPYALDPGMPADQKVFTEVDGYSSSPKLGLVHGLDKRLGHMVLPNQNARADCPVMRRTMRKLFFGSPVVVRQANNQSAELLYTAFLGANGGGRNYKPHDGPPKWLREKGSWAGYAVAMKVYGGPPVATVWMNGEGDPNSVATPKMAVEVALGLTNQGPADGEGGYLTPSMAMPLKELNARLKNRNIATIGQADPKDQWTRPVEPESWDSRWD